MKVLSIDDVAVIRKLAGKVVGALGGELLEASDGQEGLFILENNPGNIDLILLDWYTPKMSGLEFLSKVKSNDKLKHIPVIMVTTENEKEKIIKAIQAGASNYLVKPFTEQELVKKILEQIGSEGYEYALMNRCVEGAMRNVLSALTGQEVVGISDINQEIPEQGGYYFGQLLVNSQVNAVIFLTVDKASANKLASLTAGKAQSEVVEEDLPGGVADLVNKTGAEAKTLLARMYAPFSLETPLILAGLLGKGPYTTNKKVFTIFKRYHSGDLQVALKIYYL